MYSELVVEREDFNRIDGEIVAEREDFTRLIGQVQEAIEELQGCITGATGTTFSEVRTEYLIEILEGLLADLDCSLKLI
jgi:hypothetical protein